MSNCAASTEAYLRQMLFTEGPACVRAFELVVTVLHPVCIGDVEDAVLREARAEYAPAVARLEAEVGSADGVGNVGRFREASSGEADILLRLLLVMRFNAFDGGIFVAFAMLNHACLPNCAKLLRKGEEGSELVAVRDVSAGEEVRISYLAPMEQPLSVRKVAIEGQHYFSLGNVSGFPLGCEESRPGLSEKAVAKIHSVLGELEGKSRKRMRQASFEERMSALTEEMDDTLGKNHVLRLRCWKLVVRVCDARLGRLARGGFDEDADKLAEYQSLILRQMSAARKVLDGLRHLWSGENHHEMATFHDVASEAIRYTLSSGDKGLQSDMFKRLGVDSFSSASKVESEHRREFRRISAAYQVRSAQQ